MDSIVDSAGKGLWAPRTIKKYKSVLEAFNRWGKQMRRNADDWYNNLKAYINQLAQVKSGVNVETTSRILLALVGEKLKKEEKEQLLVYMRLCRRKANQYNPPVLRASQAIRYVGLIDIVRRAAAANVSVEEKQALDVLIVSFCTMSRAHEVTELTVSCVAEDGGYIIVRPKTEAKSWRLFKKCVRDGPSLRPASILRARRREALERGCTYMFNERVELDLPMGTQTVTRALKSLTQKLGIKTRVTAHSARKGSAVELILNGIPLVVVKAWGIWANLDTLEAYIGRTIREEVPLTGLMPAVAQ